MHRPAAVAVVPLRVRADGGVEVLPTFFVVELAAGDAMQAVDNGGGGYGDPRLREPERVLHDVREGLVSVEAASDTYAVAVTGSVEDDTLAVDKQATGVLRA